MVIPPWVELFKMRRILAGILRFNDNVDSDSDDKLLCNYSALASLL